MSIITRKTSLKQNPAFFTYDPKHGGRYYFAPTNTTPPPYHTQIATAILDIASDGTLAGIELVFGELPPPPPNTNTEEI